MTIQEQIQMIFLYKALLTGWNIKNISHNKFELNHKKNKISKCEKDCIIKPSSLDIDEFIRISLFTYSSNKTIQNIIDQDKCTWTDMSQIL